MKFCISFGKFELKYFFYLVLLVIIELYIFRFINYIEVKILEDHLLFNSFCLFLGYLLNIIPIWISHIKSKGKENSITNIFRERITESNIYITDELYEEHLSIKKILKFSFICLIPLLERLIENIISIIDTKRNNDDDNKDNYDDDFIIIEYIIIFLVSKFDKEVHYKHQYISFFF